MQLTEGLTIFHVIAAILGIILFITSLALFVRAALNDTYPKPLIACLVIGGMLVVFPVTGKFEAVNLLDSVDVLTRDLQKDPNNMSKRNDLLEQTREIEKWDFKSPSTKFKLDEAEKVLKSLNPGS